MAGKGLMLPHEGGKEPVSKQGFCAGTFRALHGESCMAALSRFYQFMGGKEVAAYNDDGDRHCTEHS